VDKVLAARRAVLRIQAVSRVHLALHALTWQHNMGHAFGTAIARRSALGGHGRARDIRANAVG